jgi:hypothetical protein
MNRVYGEEMIKYVDSFTDTEALTASGSTTYSTWYDISWANEIYSWLAYAETSSTGANLVDVTLQRETKGSYANQTVLTHTQIGAAGTEEKHGMYWGSTDASNVAANNVLGTRVRWKYITGGTNFTGTVTLTMNLVAVRR